MELKDFQTVIAKRKFFAAALFLSVLISALSCRVTATTMDSPLIHKVRRGETLWEISIKYKIPMSRLIEVNELTDINKLKVDQSLVIPVVPSKTESATLNPSGQSGMYHRLQKGDTLWHLSRRYQVSAEEIIKANNILAPDSLKIGQVLFIPMTPAQLESLNSVEKMKLAVRRLVAVSPVVEARKWQYIVVHHSATDVGNAKSFHSFHKFKRHMANGLAYHFVITNGNKSRDGEIEVGNRWTQQIQGGHVKSDYYNNYGIGICIVGNFMKYIPTDRQFYSLQVLVQVLQEQYGIQAQRVIGHGEIPKEYTECPGKLFPMRQLRSKLLY